MNNALLRRGWAGGMAYKDPDAEAQAETKAGTEKWHFQVVGAVGGETLDIMRLNLARGRMARGCKPGQRRRHRRQREPGERET